MREYYGSIIGYDVSSFQLESKIRQTTLELHDCNASPLGETVWAMNEFNCDNK